MGLEALLLSLRRAAFAGYQGLSKKRCTPILRSECIACCFWGRELLRCGTRMRLRVVLLAISVSRQRGLPRGYWPNLQVSRLDRLVVTFGRS